MFCAPQSVMEPLIVETEQPPKCQIKAHWEKEPCDGRYGKSAAPFLYFDEIAKKRYEIEPVILHFADFKQGRGKRILEIGVGLGTDFSQWVRYGALAVGVDLTLQAVRLTQKNLEVHRVPRKGYGLCEGDAERLPFKDSSFDMVYSWGVLHHTPRTDVAFAEAFRVLADGGTLKAMVYHVPSWTGWLLWLRHGLLAGRLFSSVREVISHHLESPGTKAYTSLELSQLLAGIGFKEVSLTSALGPSDLLLIELSDKYDSFIYRILKVLYPGWLVRLVGSRYGLLLLTKATKPGVTEVHYHAGASSV
jgi:ubiquinone/menaquinone biosynthesis C-methylase UbiE